MAPGEDDKVVGRRRLLRTVTCICAWVCMGLFSEVSAPTIPYLKQRVAGNYEEISRTLVARSLGFLLGCLTAGVIFVRWMRLADTWLGLSLLVASVATAVAPWCQRLELLGVAFFADGASKGILAVGSNTLIIAMWKSNAPVPMNALHFAFGVGALMAPQLCRPFLPTHLPSVVPANTFSTGAPEGPTENFSSVNTGGAPVSAPASFTRVEGENIEVVYAIIAICTCLCGLWFLVQQVACKPHGDDLPNKNSGRFGCRMSMCPNGCNVAIAIFLPMLFVFWSLPVGAERAYGKFLFSFAVDSNIHMVPRMATILETVFWASFTASRGIATLASRWVSPAHLLICVLTIKIVSACLLAAFADTNQIVLWVGSSTFGASVSPIFPASLLWVNLYLEMDAMMNAFAFVASAFGAMVFSWLSGYLFEYHGPPYLMYFMVCYAILVTALFGGLSLYIRIPKVRNTLPNENQRNSETGNENQDMVVCSNQVKDATDTKAETSDSKGS